MFIFLSVFYFAISVCISPSSSSKGAAIKRGKFSAGKGDEPPVVKLTGALSRSSARPRAAVVCGGNKGGGNVCGGVAAANPVGRAEVRVAAGRHLGSNGAGIRGRRGHVTRR